MRIVPVAARDACAVRCRWLPKAGSTRVERGPRWHPAVALGLKKALRPPLTPCGRTRGRGRVASTPNAVRARAASGSRRSVARRGSPRGAVRGPVGKPVVSSVVKIATRKHSGNRLRMSLRRALVDVFPQKGRGPGWRIHSRRAGLRSYALRNLRGAAHGTRQRPALRRLFTLMGLSGPQPGPTPVCGVRRSASGRARWRATGSPVSLTPCLLMTRRIGPQTSRPVCPFSPGLHPWRSRGAGGPQA
jgi:hypothetical protein